MASTIAPGGGDDYVGKRGETGAGKVPEIKGKGKDFMRHPTGVQSGQETDWKKLRILVFGLDDQFRFLARQTFRKQMVREVESYSVPADTPALMAKGVDIVLVDIGQGGEDGLAVIERLRRPEGCPFDGVPILVVAPPVLKELIERAKGFGVEGIIPKPVSGHELSHRVAETLAHPQRLLPPVAAKPKVSFIKEAEPLPDLPEVAPVAVQGTAAGPAGQVPEVAAFMARFKAREEAAAVVTPGNPARPSRGGPADILVAEGLHRPLPIDPPPPVSKPAVPEESRPVPAARPVPPPVVTRGFASADAPAASPRRVTGGKLDADDLAPPPVKRTGDVGIEVAGLRPDLEAEEARRRAAKRRRQWQEEMEAEGHKARKGKDVAVMDFTAVVAEHGQWLLSKGAEGKRATFTGMDLAGADLAGAVLANATFREVDLSDACLAEARLDGSDFRYASMQATDLAGANLGVAALRHAKLNLSNLEGAVLRGSDLSGAILTGARLAGADFKGAVMMGADLREADLSKAEGLTTAQIDKTICDMGTRLPPGVFRPVKMED